MTLLWVVRHYTHHYMAQSSHILVRFPAYDRNPFKREHSKLSYILIIKANEMYYFSNLFDKFSDRSTVHHQQYLNAVYTQYVFVMLKCIKVGKVTNVYTCTLYI